MSSITEKQLMNFIIAVDRKEDLTLLSICTKVKDELNIDTILQNHQEIISVMLRKYRKLKAKHKKKWL